MTAAKEILTVLDDCAANYTFPMLDNGYVYLAAARLSLFRSQSDWAMAIEIFGYSPRSWLPDVHVHTFASRLYDRRPPEVYTSQQVEDYLQFHPNDEMRFFYPLQDGDWIDAEQGEFVEQTASHAQLRGRPVALPERNEYATAGIALADPDRIHIFEFCRYLAATEREEVLASPEERRANVLPDMKQILQLEDWRHPDVTNGDMPSTSPSFRQLARVLETGDVRAYTLKAPGNTHWRNWPMAGLM